MIGAPCTCAVDVPKQSWFSQQIVRLQTLLLSCEACITSLQVLLLASLALSLPRWLTAPDYVLIIDAGSTGTRM